MTSTYNTPLEPVFSFVAECLSSMESTFYRLPGSAIIERYVRSSHQNDPGRTLLELILVALVIRTLLQSRTRADRSAKNFIEFSDKVREFYLHSGPRDSAVARKLTNSLMNGYRNHWHNR